jgi:hypothetical protein
MSNFKYVRDSRRREGSFLARFQANAYSAIMLVSILMVIGWLAEKTYYRSLADKLAEDQLQANRIAAAFRRR